MPMRKVKVRLGNNSYQIHIGSGILGQSGYWLKENWATDKLVIITHPSVKRLYGDALEEKLAREGYKVITLLVPEGEEQKSLETAGRLYNELSGFHAERSTPILALGGGVIGDLAGFVAATYLRGVPLVQIPTTLLAQVDSSIGGKVAVNHGLLKNKIGAFYQPRMVISDITTLKSLPTGEISDGLGEVIKYGVIRDGELFTYLEENLDGIKVLDNRALETIVSRSAKIKAEVVEKDERDFSIRHILNYGHTVGHGLETMHHYRLPHGFAVAFGMLKEAGISRALGMLKDRDMERIADLLTAYGMTPVRFRTERLVRLMSRDKKSVHSGKNGEPVIPLVLPVAIEGRSFILTTLLSKLQKSKGCADKSKDRSSLSTSIFSFLSSQIVSPGKSTSGFASSNRGLAPLHILRFRFANFGSSRNSSFLLPKESKAPTLTKFSMTG